MTYFYLGLVAVLSGLIGFFLHAFWFGGSEERKLRQKVDSLQKALEEKQAEAREAQEEITKTSTIVRSLQQQIRQRNDEMEHLQRIAARQDVEITALQKDAAAIRAALDAPGKRRELPVQPGIVPVLEPGQPKAHMTSVPVRGEAAVAQVPPTQGEKPAPPVWRETLGNIIDVLDRAEKK